MATTSKKVESCIEDIRITFSKIKIMTRDIESSLKENELFDSHALMGKVRILHDLSAALDVRCQILNANLEKKKQGAPKIKFPPNADGHFM